MLRRILFSLLLLAPIHVSVCQAEQEPADSPQAMDLLRRATERIQKSEAFTADMEMSIRVGLPGFQHEKGGVYKLAAARPNRLLVLRTHGDIGATIATDGKQMTLYVPELRQYVHRDAPATLDDFSNDFAVMSLMEQGVGSNFMALLAKDPYSRLIEGALSSKVLGVATIDGLECDHLRFEKETSVVDIWVTRGDAPTLRRISTDLAKQLEGEEDAAGFSIVATLELRVWDLAADLGDDTFGYKPPGSATLEEDFAAIVPEAVMPPIAVPSHHPLLGELAPEFALVELSGNKAFELKPMIGKKVILLDFWATWCGPCRQGLPDIAAVAKDFADKPVGVYAVNIEQDAETIQQFLDDTKLELNVLRDSDGDVARKYQATGIPQTVLIGLDGRVQVVHVGLASKDKITEEITALLNREDLATKVLNAEEREAAEEEAAEADENGEMEGEGDADQQAEPSEENTEETEENTETEADG